MFGVNFDGNSPSCQACQKDFKETATVCEALALEKQTKPKSGGKKAVKSSKTLNVFGHGERTGADKIDQILLSLGDGTTTLEELSEKSGRKLSAVRAHIGHLKKEHGLIIKAAKGQPKGTITVTISKEIQKELKKKAA